MTGGESLKEANGSSGFVEIKKKKRQRTRIRKRNKNYHALVNGNGTAEKAALPATSTPQQQVAELIEQVLQSPKSTIQKPIDIDSTLPLANCCNANQNEVMKPVAAAPQKPSSAESAVGGGTGTAKTRDQILAEREAKKLAKQSKKTKTGEQVETAPPSANSVAAPVANDATPPVLQAAVAPVLASETAAPTETASGEKLRDQIKAEREAKKQAKHSAKVAKSTNAPAAVAPAPATVAKVTQQLAGVQIDESTAVQTAAAVESKCAVVAQDEKKKPTLSKAERRGIQEAQRAAKSQKSAPQKPATISSASARVAASMKTSPTAGGGNTEKSPNTSSKSAAPTTASSSSSPAKTITTTTKSTTNDCKVKLFNHLKSARKDVSLFVNNPQIHPSIARLGEQYAQRTIVGSNARCIAFLNALKMVIQDFETPPKKEFSRSLETSIKNCVEHLQKCRPLAVSVTNAYKHIKHVLTQLPTDKLELELKENLCHFIDTYIENQIGKAAQAISSSMQEKIKNGDVILTFGCSSLINYICEEAHRRHVDFRVIVVDSRPFCEGQELLRRLTAKEIPCTYVLINALGFVMPEATKVLLGAHALLSNGYVMARTGTAQVALVARAFNVPVLVCCETHKFSESFQTDAIVYNELGNPDDLILSDKCCLTNWQAKNKMSPLNLIYDITPPELVTAVVTEVSILPCTSVPVILRIKPTEIGYYS